jgi:hypothetical protein
MDLLIEQLLLEFWWVNGDLASSRLDSWGRTDGSSDDALYPDSIASFSKSQFHCLLVDTRSCQRGLMWWTVAECGRPSICKECDRRIQCQGDNRNRDDYAADGSGIRPESDRLRGVFGDSTGDLRFCITYTSHW